MEKTLEKWCDWIADTLKFPVCHAEEVQPK